MNATAGPIGSTTGEAARVRALTMFERALYVDGREPVLSILTARVRGKLGEPALRSALSRLQAKHPLLRSFIRNMDGRPHFVVQHPAPPIPLKILQRRHDSDWLRESRSEWSAPFQTHRMPLMRMVWLRGEEVSELMLVCHHCICDGRSMVGLLGDILSLCDRPGQDFEVSESLPFPTDQIPGDIAGSRAVHRRILAKVILLKGFLRLWRSGKRRFYGNPYLIHWEIGEEISQALAARCKLEGATIFAALAAAFIEAFRLKCGGRIRRFVAPVDVRRFFRGLPKDSLFAMAPTVRLAHAHRPEDFWGSARALRADVERKLERMAPKIFENLLFLEKLHGLADRIAPFMQSLPSGKSMTFSNLGRVSMGEDYRNFQLDMLHAPSAMLAPTPANLITCLGFAGKLSFSFMSDEQSLSIDDAAAIKDRAMAILLEAIEPAGRIDAAEVRGMAGEVFS